MGNNFQKKNRHETNKAIDVMKEYGLTVNTPTPDQVKKWEDLIERMYPDLRGSLIDEVTFDRLMENIKEYLT